ncbi:SRPBCC family protein [Saccharothrix obliqua]|uniref:SRPBCC family protein n=1 Tax=Saccharothrix obliqua TaxID=2861747 RepID=UPI001C5DDA3D|nr:SRPBCC domain-containing protein [Saccharothrix obliqua]MBW4719057.1 SRPBCC domain-containing protein [Saccharothrix obliqua]
MGHAFEETNEALLADVTPEQVWEAIATGPGIDSWFMGVNEVEPGAVVRGAFNGYEPRHGITAWEPGKHLAYGGEKAPDGRFMAYEFLIEGRDHGSTVLRMVAGGFLPGDDWQDEFEAMTAGGAMFWRTLLEYLGHFAGRTARPVTVIGPEVTDWPALWSALHRKLGLTTPPRIGDTATVDGERGVVYYVNSQTIGIRTPDAMYRFFQGITGVLIAMHHVFADDQRDDHAWSVWLNDLAVL